MSWIVFVAKVLRYAQYQEQIAISLANERKEAFSNVQGSI